MSTYKLDIKKQILYVFCLQCCLGQLIENKSKLLENFYSYEESCAIIKEMSSYIEGSQSSKVFNMNNENVSDETAAKVSFYITYP